MLYKDAQAIAQFTFKDKYTEKKDLLKRPEYLVRIFDDGTWEVTSDAEDHLMTLQQGYWSMPEWIQLKREQSK